MNLSLEPYQQLMVDHLAGRERAYANVGVGLGKTAATLTALQSLFREGAIRAALVVAPLRVARMTWPNEIAKWDGFRWMRVEQLRGQTPSGRAHLYLINYERLPQLADLDFCDAVVFDEITRAKNHASKRIKALRPLLRHHRRWGLTGTPRPNSLLEVFAQVRLLDDGERLGRSYAAFRDAHFYPTDYMRYNWAPKPGAEERVYAKLRDLTITLRTSDYLDMPDTVVEDVDVALPSRALYLELEKEFLALVGKGEVVARNAAVLVNKLLQVTGGAIYTESGDVEVIHSGKIDALSTLIKRVGEPVLVACQYIHERERICRSIPGAINSATFKGDIESAWNEGRLPVLVADPRSLGHGLNMQAGGRTVIWYSPTWSRELYDQFNGRVARKGQDRQPQVFHILCPDTIDDAVMESLREKGEGQQAMLRIMANYREMRA